MGKVGKTRDQWGKFIGTVGLCVGSGILAGQYAVLGDMTNMLVAGVFLAPLGAYGNKVRRFGADVRYRAGKLQRTGDGGQDQWTVIVAKHWVPFWRSPLDHFKLPFHATEVTVDTGGYAAGSVRCGKRPITVIAGHEKTVVPIGSDDSAPSATRHEVARLATVAVKADIGMRNIMASDTGYDDLTKFQRQKMSENDFYKLLGLCILKRDGLKLS